MSAKTFLVALLLMIVNIVSVESAVWQARNSISGTVSNSEGSPLNRMRVELLNEVEMTVAQTYTDSTGHYNFRNLTPGTFIVRVHTNGAHIGQSARVNLVALRPNGGAHYEQIDFILKTRIENKGTAVPGNTGTTFAQDIPEKARRIYERATKQLESGKNSEQGINSLKEAITVFPAYYQALERLGVEYVKIQQHQQAKEILEKAAEVNPNGASCQYALGVAYFHLHMIQEASQNLRRSVTLAPESSNAAFAHFYLGLAYWKLGKHGDSEPHLQKAYSMGGNSIPADIHLYLAQYYSDSQRYHDAANELELFLKLVPNARDSANIKILVKKLRAKTPLTTVNR